MSSVKVLFDRSEKRVDLSDLDGLGGSVSKDQVKGDFKRLVSGLKPGNYCVVREKKINGPFRSSTSWLFQVGDRGLVARPSEKGASLGIDVKTQTNSAGGVRERIVWQEGFGRRFLANPAIIDLNREAISNMDFFNEGTFSRGPGAWISHPIGEYIDSITVGQSRIRKDFAQHLEEFEIRKGSIPFVLPSQYLGHIFHNSKFGSLVDAANLEAIDIFTEKGYLENLEYPGDNDCPYESGTKEYRKFWRDHRRSVEKFEDSRKERKDLLKLLESGVGYRMVKTVVLNSFWDSLGGNFRVSSDGERYRVSEINPHYERDSEGEYKEMSKRGFKIIPSRMMPGQIYTIPNDELSAMCLLGALGRFNERYPDTGHIPEAKENYVAASVVN